jgi:hypothetical protein
MNRKQFCVVIAIVLGMLFPITGLVFADNFIEFLKSAEQNYKAEKYTKALKDLEWARKEITGKQLEEMRKFLPDEIDGIKGESDDSSAVMGLHSVSKVYRDLNTGNNVKIEIMKGSSGDGATGLGAIIGMAAAMGTMDQGGQSKTIVQKGYRGTFSMNSEINEGQLIFSLDGGSIVTIETRGYPDETMAKKTAEKLDLATIEEKMK